MLTGSWGMTFNTLFLFVAGAFNCGPDVILGKLTNYYVSVVCLSICLSVCQLQNLSGLLLRNYWCTKSRCAYSLHFPIQCFLSELWPFNYFLTIPHFPHILVMYKNTKIHRLKLGKITKFKLTLLGNISLGMVEWLGLLAAWVQTLSGASHCFFVQETLHSLLSTDWFQEHIREWVYK